MKHTLKDASMFDFLRSCLTASPFACIAAITFILFSIFPAADKLAVNRLGYKLVFFGDSGYAMFVYLIIIAVGFLIALAEFRFLGNKSQTIVVMSSGLKRSTLFKNRVFASMAVMFVSILVPFTITLILNARYVGVEAYTIKTFLLFLVSAYTAMLIGFAIGTFTSVLSGTTVEAAACGCVLLFFPLTFIYFCYLCCNKLLKGYFSPLSLGANYPIRQAYYLNPLNLIFTSSDQNHQGSSTIWTDRAVIFAKTFAEDPAYAKASQTFSLSEFMLFFVWIAVCLLILLASYRTLNKRKAEKNGYLRSSKAIAGILTSFFVLLVSLLGIYASDFIISEYYKASDISDIIKNLSVYGTIFICAFIVLSLCLLIYYGSFKKIKKVLALSPLALLALAVPLCCTLGGFGYQYRVPSADNIESASITLPYGPGKAGYLQSGYMPLFADFTSKSDINTIIDIHRTLTGETDDQTSKKNNEQITVEYKLKDGTYFYRQYYYTSDYASLKTTSLFDSDKVEEYLYSQYGDKSKWIIPQDWTGMDPIEAPYFEMYKAVPQSYKWLVFDNVTVSLRASDSFERTDITSELDSESFDKLLQMYAKDLIVMNANGFFTPDKSPIGVITLKEKLEPESQYDESHYTHDLYIYSDMYNTLGYLDLVGVKDAFNKKSEIKEINFYKCDKKEMFVQNAIAEKHNELLHSLITDSTLNELTPNGVITEDFYVPGSAADLATKPFATYTKKEDIESIRSKMYPCYLTVGQSVSFACVTYADGLEALFIIKN